ncbi:MAG TPA: Crp/Fnr family transcriptional regulator [Pyrinomonadaceae bacterium]|nr:Crp/Fnr family transcriptional regulator [Pyrinomonadaceae bacterium]
MLKLSIRKKLSANEQIFAENEQATFLPIVLKGKVKMVRFPDVGKEVIIGIFQTGEIFAIPPALDGKKFPATAIAMEETQLLFLPRPAFLNLMKESSEFSAIIMERMCGLLRDRTETVQILTTPSSEKRVGTVLLRLTIESNESQPKKITLRRQDIAEMSGLTIETTIRAIRSLAKKDYVEIIRGKIIVKNTEQLENFLR